MGAFFPNLSTRHGRRLLIRTDAVVLHVRVGVEVESRAVVAGAVVQEGVKIKVVEDIRRVERILPETQVELIEVLKFIISIRP